MKIYKAIYFIKKETYLCAKYNVKDVVIIIHFKSLNFCDFKGIIIIQKKKTNNRETCL